MVQTETILDRTDRIKAVATVLPAVAEAQVLSRDIAMLWNSGLSSSLLFSVSEPPVQSSAESEAQSIVALHVHRTSQLPTNPIMTDMVDLQRALQMRSKVITAIQMLICG